jgi:phytoene synthase
MATRSAEEAAADYAACREMIRQGSRTFFAASLLLPRSVREPSYALYAFCRLSDDAVDGPGARRDAVDRLRDRLDLIYDGRPAGHPADRAFADVVRRHAMPKALPEALLEGLAWDSEGRRYATLGELQAYCARVASAVGAMMTVIMGARDAAVLARACDLGVAMQLTNIARDVGEDARAGRIYLPLDWLAAEGIDPDAFLRHPVFDERIGRVTRRLLAEADTLYARSGTGVRGLPPTCRPAIHAARLIYREIGVEVRRNGHDSVSGRAVVGGKRKMALALRSLAAAGVPGVVGADEALPETQFLVSAAAAPAGPDRRGGATGPWAAADQRIGWVIDLFSQLDDRQRDYGAFAAPSRATEPGN